MIVKISNAPKGSKRPDFHPSFERFGEIKFIDCLDDHEFATVRYRESSPEAAVAAVAFYA